MNVILFDLDGTLVEAKEWHYEALNKALRLFGYEISRKNHLTTYDGLPTRDKLQILTEKEGLPETLYDLIFYFKQEFTYLEIEQQCKPLPNVVSTLQELKTRGYSLGLCSNSIRKSVEMMLTYSGILEYFDLILSNQDVVFSKPNPEMYLTAKSRFGVSTEDCLVVEDNEKGVEAGRRAGMRVLRVNSPKDISINLFEQWL